MILSFRWPLSQSAWLVYHSVFWLSSTFFKFFEVFLFSKKLKCFPIASCPRPSCVPCAEINLLELSKLFEQFAFLRQLCQFTTRCSSCQLFFLFFSNIFSFEETSEYLPFCDIFYTLPLIFYSVKYFFSISLLKCWGVNDWLHFTFNGMSRVRWRFSQRILPDLDIECVKQSL